MNDTKRYVSVGVTAVLVTVFVCIMLFSLWCGAKNSQEIITLYDTHCLADNQEEVYNEAVTNDSMSLRTAALLSQVADPFYVWVLINIVSSVVTVMMLYYMIGRTYRGFVRIILVALFAFLPMFFRNASAISANCLESSLILFMLFVAYSREDTIWKWYLMLCVCAFVVSGHSVYNILLYIIPIAAYIGIKKSHDAGKAASHALILLLMALIVQFLFVRAFSWDKATADLLGVNSYRNGPGVLERLFVYNTKEKIGLYLPINIMALVSFLGLFFVEKYVRKYILPGLIVYVWVVFATDYSSVYAAQILPVIFFSFSKTVIHLGITRKYKNALAVSLIAVTFVSLVCDVYIASNNHDKGRAVAEYCTVYSGVYDREIFEDGTVMVIDDRGVLAYQRYCAYPKRVILACVNDDYNALIQSYKPDYIISCINDGFEEYTLMDNPDEELSDITFIYKKQQED